MLTSRIAHFHDLVNDARARVGNSPPRIADDIIAIAFPRTVEEAEREGADKMLRRGVIGAVAEAVRRPRQDDDTRDMAEIEESYRPIVTRLHSHAYYVPSMHEQVDIADLISTPEFLDEARKFLRQKGMECRDQMRARLIGDGVRPMLYVFSLDEARTLDDLYLAVTGP